MIKKILSIICAVIAINSFFLFLNTAPVNAATGSSATTTSSIEDEEESGTVIFIFMMLYIVILIAAIFLWGLSIILSCYTIYDCAKGNLPNKGLWIIILTLGLAFRVGWITSVFYLILENKNRKAIK